MRRFTLSILLALFAVGGVWAAELNIYASGLRVNNCVTETNQVTIQYFLNAPATNLELVVIDASTGLGVDTITVPAGASSVNYEKGVHSSVEVDLASVPTGTYKWALIATNSTATASVTKISDGSEKFILYAPKGVVVNNYPETDAFGTIYVSMPADGQSDGLTATSRAQKQGIFVWNPKLDLINTSNAGYKGDLTWQTDNSYGAYRLKVAVNGDLYMGASHSSVHNLYKISADYTHFEPLLGHSPKVSGFEMVGDQIYALENTGYDKDNSKCVGNLIQYDVDDLPVSEVGTTYATAETTKTTTDQTSLESDGRGGFWIGQYRYYEAANASGYPILVHLSTAKTIDWSSYSASLGLSLSTRGAMAVSPDKNRLAICTGAASSKKIYIYSITWPTSTPSLTKVAETGVIGNNVDGVAFDYAGNLYAVNSSAELLYVWALPKSPNTCTTPAASTRTITLSTQVTSVSLDETSYTIPVGKSFTLTPTVAPATATDKSCTWESSNTSIATVDENGVVKAIAPGSATITVTTTNRGETATCDVTVSAMAGTYNIGGENAHFDHLADACSEICTNGISGNVVMLICDDLEETSNSGIINDTEYSITIKPNAATKRTISFGASPDNVGPSGHIMIGNNRLKWASDRTKNVIIDGSYNDEGQYLEFQAGSIGGVVVVYYGYVTESVVKNCRLINPRTSGTNYVAHFRSEQGSDKAPTGVGFENCYMQVIGATNNTYVLYYNGTQSATDAGKPQDCYVKNCELISNLRGIHISGAVNTTITENTFRIPQGADGMLSSAIYGHQKISGNVVVSGNKFVELKTKNKSTGDLGMQAITASGGGTWTIENNYFAGIDAINASASTADMKLVYIRCGNTCVIRHNTFFMPSLTNKPASPTYVSSSQRPITCVCFAANGHTVKNNLFVSAETSANNSFLYGSLVSNTVQNNVYYHAGGNAYIVAASASKQTWDEFIEGGANPGSKWINPTFVDAANGNLAISAKNEDLRLTRLSQVLTDINGIERPASTYAGAWEPIAVTGLTLNTTEQSIEWPNIYTLTATIVPDNATFKDPVTWTSSNENIATVSSTGVVKALSPGMTTISATSGSVSATCAITVTPSANALHGTYRIGSVANADYASLHAACAAADTYGLSGNVEFLICSDLTETQNSGIINTTDYTLTIRPDTDADRTITFTQSTDNEGPSGAFFIGCDMTLTHVDIPTKNVIIDGYAEGGSTRRLTMKIGSGFGSPWGPIIFYGQTTGCAVKNMKIINELVTTTSTEVTTHYAIILRPASGTNHTPTGVRIENNYIENATHSAGQAIVFMGGSNSASYPIGTVIKNNEIVASIRGIFFSKGNSTTIEGNTFRIRPKGAGYLSHAILGDTEVGEITVRNNKFVELPSMSTANSYGMRAITASGGATKWIIENNFFGGIDATATAGNIELTYVRCVDNCEVRHNTFHMPSLTKKPTTSLTSTSPITCLYLANSHDYIVQNNIFVSDETVANNSLIRGNLNENIQNNVLYHAGGNAAIVAGTITYTTFADLPAAYQTANIDQKVTFSSDYHISDTYVGNLNLGVTPIAGITTDIDGNLRHNPTYAGCFEASDWSTTSLYLDETQNNTANIAAAEAANVPTNVTINRRFVVADALYTLILPFDLSAAQLAEAFGAGYKLMELSESYMKTESMMYINFVPASSLTAGKPYLFQTGEDIDHDIVFSGVTIKSTLSPITTELVDMSGVYDPTIVSYSDNNYFLGNNDYLYPYTDQTPTTKGFRAYFHFHDAPANCVARVVFRDDVTTDLEDETFETAPAVQKIIRNGQLIIIRDGIEYNAQGQIIK